MRAKKNILAKIQSSDELESLDEVRNFKKKEQTRLTTKKETTVCINFNVPKSKQYIQAGSGPTIAKATKRAKCSSTSK